MPRFDTAGNIINGAAGEVGLTPVSDPFASTDPNFVQLRNLLTVCGRELFGARSNGWAKLTRKFSFTTPAVPVTNVVALPTDFGYFLDQTGWNPTERLPLGGPLTVQDWDYLVATNLAPSTIYLCFYFEAGEIRLLPNPPPANTTISFSYVSRNWVGDGTTFANDQVTNSSDVVYYEPILIQKLLKLRFLEAKGFDSRAAAQQFNQVWETYCGKDKSAPVLSMARGRVYPYLSWRNVPETGFGQP
jgi:hypothetical protein